MITKVLTVAAGNTEVVAALAVNSATSIASESVGGNRCGGQSITFGVTAGGTSSVDMPVLHIRTEAGQTVLSWPSAAGLFALQSRDSLSGGSGWVAVTNVAVVNGSAYEVPVVMSGNHFYRLVSMGTSGSFSYQWRKGGVNVSGATSANYTIPSVTAADAGDYD